MTTESSAPSETEAKYRASWSLPGSAERNSEAIAAALSPLLSSTPSTSRTPLVLEVASGFGHQIHAIASRHPSHRFVPSEADAYPRTQIDTRNADLTNVAPAEALDLLDQNDWLTLVHNTAAEQEVSSTLAGADESLFDGVIACNLTHIAPWKVTESLFSHLDPRLGYATQQGYRHLVSRSHGWIAIYGAFNEHGAFTSEGNKSFHNEIRKRNPEFGLRDVQSELQPLAQRHGYQLAQRIEMPAGNLLLIFRVRKD